MAGQNVFPPIPSALDLRGAPFRANRDEWEPVLKEFQDALQVCSGEGAARALQSHQARGQLLGGFDGRRRRLVTQRRHG